MTCDKRQSGSVPRLFFDTFERPAKPIQAVWETIDPGASLRERLYLGAIARKPA